MNTARQFWTLRFACPQDLVTLVEQAMEDYCAAFSLLESENGKAPVVELLFETEPQSQDIKEKLSAQGLVGESFNPTFEITSLGNLDWIKEVSANLAPMNIGRWTIFGAAYKDKINPGTLGLQIDATSAFGTGEHPTTRGCLLMLDHILNRFPKSQNWNMLDMGCGSGILAMAFVTATNGRALGIDMDEDSVAIARENLANNKLNKNIQIEVGEGYAKSIIRHNAPYDLIMANVFARPLCEMAKDLKEHLRPGGLAILSGIMGKQANMVAAAHRQQGLKVIKRMRLGTWSVLALRRPIRAS